MTEQLRADAFVGGHAVAQVVRQQGVQAGDPPFGGGGGVLGGAWCGQSGADQGVDHRLQRTDAFTLLSRRGQDGRLDAQRLGSANYLRLWTTTGWWAAASSEVREHATDHFLDVTAHRRKSRRSYG